MAFPWSVIYKKKLKIYLKFMYINVDLFVLNEDLDLFEFFLSIDSAQHMPGYKVYNRLIN